ncbi:twin-arginine translocase TatA/TatE family subunit [Streptomyces sp. NPDC004561]
MFRDGLQPWQMLILAIAIILLFGPKKLPEIARALGKSLGIPKSQAKAMKGESAQPSSAAADAEAATEPRLRIIRSAPGETGAARPAGEKRSGR